MAIILKEGKTFNPQTPQAYGFDMTGSDYYGVIDSIEYDKKKAECYFTVDIYSSSAAHKDGSSVVDRMVFKFRDSDFGNIIGNDGLSVTQAYGLALSSAVLTDWESDEA